VAPPAPGNLTVAHPHRAPLSGDLVSYAVHFGPRSSYRIYTRAPGTGQTRVLATLPVQNPAYMHSFAVTENYAVLVEFPFTALPVAIPLSGRPFIENYQWKPQRGTRFSVIELATGQLRGTYQGEAFFAFHHVNAFERGGDIVIDLCAYDNADVVAALYLDRLRDDQFTVPHAELRRYRVPLGGGDVTRESVPGVPLELPRIDYGRRNGRAYRYAYGAGGDRDFLHQILKVDLESGTSTVWSEPGTYPGEPVFVPSPGSQREDDEGVLLSVVLDPATDTSFLLALDAADLTELARARVPHHIPFGFHGDFFPESG
jgi:beta,beta-carotene 9',10'-dioxygenase